ncbi:MAG: hypothetical protein K1X89_10290 [Myxococcaceae bacterium]|nr:hypothetical protein [Myxococcaceae bacterium]
MPNDISVASVARQIISYSPEEQKLLNSAPPEQRAKLQLEMMEQKKSELVSFLSNILKMKHDAAMAIIANMH